MGAKLGRIKMIGAHKHQLFSPVFARSDDDDDDLGGGGDDLDLDGDDDGDDDGNDDDGDDGEDLSESEKKILKALTPTLQNMGQSIADRLVNAQNTRERKAARQRDRETRETRSSSSRSAAQAQRQAEERERELKNDIRDGRSAFKDAFGDTGVRLSSAEEREAANAMGRALVETAVRNGEDPDDAGAHAATTVAKMIRSTRKSAESGVMARLEKQGVDLSALKGSTGKGRQASRGPQATGVGANVRAGESKAKELFPGRVAVPQNK